MNLFEQMQKTISTSTSPKGKVGLEVEEGTLESTDFDLDYLEGIIKRGQSSKLLYWEVYNFAQYRHEKFEVGEDGVILLKAFNSVGKSNALKALQFALTASGVGISHAKKFIKEGYKKARIITRWSDGIEIEYIMQRATTSTDAKSPRFINGYRMYEWKDGEKREIFNSYVDGKMTKINDVPSVIKRYLNLAEIDGKYLNFMRKYEKMTVLEQSPRSLMKTMSKVADLETAEKAIAKITADNKDSVQDLESSSSKIKVYTQDILDRRHLTEKVITRLSEDNDKYNKIATNSNLALSLSSSLVGLDELAVQPKASTVNLGILRSFMGIQDEISDLNASLPLPPAPEVDLNALQSALSVQSAIFEVSKYLLLSPKAPTIDYAPLQSALGIKESLDKLNDYQIARVSEPDFSALLTALEVKQGLEKITHYDKELDQEVSHLEDLSHQMDEVLETLKSKGYPVGICSHCGHLSINKSVTGASDLVALHNH